MKFDAAPSSWLRSDGVPKVLLHSNMAAPALQPPKVLRSTRSPLQLSLPFLDAEPRAGSRLKPVLHG